jgi:membrane fusion protein (multidrug efflux system)
MNLLVRTTPAGTGTPARTWRLVRRIALALVLAGALAVLLLLLAGFFRAKVPGEGPAPARAPAGLAAAEVRLIHRPRFETAVGTVRAVHEAAVASKLLARVTAVLVKAGLPVNRDQVLVRLDDSDLKARLHQAEAALAAAQASREKADADYARAVRLSGSRAISAEALDQAAAARRVAAAEAERANQGVREARVVLDFATVRAPLTGIVIDKRVEVGDTVSPGQTLLTLFNPTRMQMIVTVRESLALRLSVGQKVRGRLEALEHECEGTVSEIVPESQAASRSFTVKVTGPCPPGAYSGMFGRIYIPLGDEKVVVVPPAAVLRVGQLDMVEVVEDHSTRRRNVQLGRRLDEGWEVLAGLSPGERVVLPAKAKEAQP